MVRFLDWAGIIMLGVVPQTIFEVVYCLFIHIFWTGTLGIAFNYIITQISSQGIIIKGGLYAFFITFIFRSLVVLFKLPILADSNLTTSITNTITSFIWGLILGVLLYILNNN